MEKNKRQIPKTVEICSNKLYNDILYGYLQSMSKWDGEKGHYRYILKQDLIFQKIAKDLVKNQNKTLSRQTVATRFKKMIELGLILDSNDKYELINLDINDIALVPKETLDLMLDVFNDHTISIYVYLLSRFIANNNEGYTCLMRHLKGQIGLSQEDNRANKKIVNILWTLQKIGLLKYHTYMEEGKKFYYIDDVKISNKEFLTALK